MWSERELFHLGEYKSQYVLALDIHYFAFGYFYAPSPSDQYFVCPELITTVHCSLWKLRGHAPCEAYSLHRGSKQTKHQGKELTEGSSCHLLSRPCDGTSRFGSPLF